ncbi:MAG: integrin alpha [Candidatus Binatia bacterium]
MPLTYRIYLSVHLSFLLICLLPTWAVARVTILENPDRFQFSAFGSALAVIGDVNGDGTPDYLVGAYNQRVNKVDGQGQAFVFSGKDGQLLLTLDDPTPQDHAAFGFAVAAAGDVSQDGVPDLLIGAFGQGGSGQVFVFSGKDGQLLSTLQAPQPQLGGGFGWAVASLGDLTGDSIAEFLIGAFGQDGEGRVFVFDGQSNKLLQTLAPPASPSGSYAFGWSVASAGDLDKDGAPDILVGAPYSTAGDIPFQGRVYTFSGREGKLLQVLQNPQPSAGAVFGWSVTANGDINKDGVPDILVGAPYQDVGANRSQGVAFALSGADGKLLFVLNDPAPKPYAGFGLVVASGPDANEDGIPEILIGAPYQQVDQFHVQGEMFVFNGRDGRHLFIFDNPLAHQGSMFGYAVASPGDIDGDKIPDFVIGAPGQSIMDKAAVGRAYVFTAKP